MYWSLTKAIFSVAADICLNICRLWQVYYKGQTPLCIIYFYVFLAICEDSMYTVAKSLLLLFAVLLEFENIICNGAGFKWDLTDGQHLSLAKDFSSQTRKSNTYSHRVVFFFLRTRLGSTSLHTKSLLLNQHRPFFAFTALLLAVALLMFWYNVA